MSTPSWLKKSMRQESSIEFERTYRRFSNLDDRYENGVHDYLKYIKFGYGRAPIMHVKIYDQGYKPGSRH